jgi:hypothetical protein
MMSDAAKLVADDPEVTRRRWRHAQRIIESGNDGEVDI